MGRIATAAWRRIGGIAGTVAEGIARGAPRVGGVLAGLARAAGRVLPARPLGRLALIGALLLAAAAVWGGNRYFAEVPVELADDYREDAQRAANRTADSMDRLYRTLDRYISASSLTPFEARRLREASTVSQYGRLMADVHHEIGQALRQARARLGDAREALQAEREALKAVPGSRWLDGSDPLREVEGAAEEGVAYLRRATRFVRSYRRFVAYEEEKLKLDRRALRSTVETEIGDDDDLDAITAAIGARIATMREVHRELRQLEPPRDAKALHRLSFEDNTIVLDYLEEVKAGFENLSLPQIEAAEARLLDGFRGRRKRWREAWYEFRADSRLQRSTRHLTRAAEELEASIGALGSGSARPLRPERERPPIPPPPGDPDRDDPGQRV